jgi:hypothetical protein
MQVVRNYVSRSNKRLVVRLDVQLIGHGRIEESSRPPHARSTRSGQDGTVRCDGNVIKRRRHFHEGLAVSHARLGLRQTATAKRPRHWRMKGAPVQSLKCEPTRSSGGPGATITSFFETLGSDPLASGRVDRCLVRLPCVRRSLAGSMHRIELSRFFFAGSRR